MKFFARKIGMTHVSEGMLSVCVTALDLSQNVYAKLLENKALIGWGKVKKPKKSQVGQYKELGFSPAVVKEVEKVEGIQIGPVIDFELPKKVTVRGISKGKGFAGVVKRYHFKGGPKTHGQSDRERAPGSIGPGTTPGRVYKGTRMAGRMGSENVTLKNLKVVNYLKDEKIVLVKGSVPGANGTLVEINW